MRKNTETRATTPEQIVKDIRRATRKQHSAEEKIRIVLAGLRGEDSIAEHCRREGIAQSLYSSWSKEFLEAGKRHLAGDTARQASSPEVKDLRDEAAALKEAVADLTLENLCRRRPRRLARAQGMTHVRGAPNHPQTQGKIERWHQTMKNRILLENYFLSGQLEAAVAALVDHYNHHRSHKSLGNLTPADVYFGRGQPILAERLKIKKLTIRNRRLSHHGQAA